MNSAIPFDLIVTTPTLAASAASTQILTLDQDAEFHLFAKACRTSADLVGDAEPNNCTVQITDQGTGRQWSNAPLEQNLFAPRQYNAPTPPIRLQAGTILRFDIVNTAAAPAYVMVKLSGMNVYPA